MLGLRGGALAKRFARGGWRVRVVEPDPLAVDVAAKHLFFQPTEVPVLVSDLRAGLRRESGRYPVVIVDAFDRGNLPPHLVTREFFAAVGSRLRPDGIVALSVLTTGWTDPVVGALAATLRQSFRTVLALPTSEPPNTLGSIVLLATNRDLSLPDERLPQPTDFLMNLEEHWKVVQMNHAWFNRYEPAAATPLTDDRNPADRWGDRIQHASRVELHQTFGRRWASW